MSNHVYITEISQFFFFGKKRYQNFFWEQSYHNLLIIKRHIWLSSQVKSNCG
uniref:Uncharacterized protein n=1 Tax=Helianthus annuus TaxID=4232 RepID=A0A251UR12_HELAN